MELSTKAFNRAYDFVRSNARPVDRALAEFTFDDAGADAVLDALSAFQNDDGGFGHGIEPDLRLSASSPLATSVGLQYAVAVDAPPDHPLIAQAVRYLITTYNVEDEYWPATFKNVNDEPHAPWWHVEEVKPPSEDDWPNPSAELTGYLHRYAEHVPSDLLERVSERARRNLDHAETIEGLYRYNILCWQRAMPALPADFREAVEAKIKATYEKYLVNEENYGEVTVFWLAPTPDAILARTDPVRVHHMLDDVITRLESEGAIWPTWQWGQYPEAWTRARMEWAGKETVEALQALREYERIED